mmetsp:Transcript_83031/g.257874  ORF Transcript_83031/g.257874 Transcript_83031/m.257874 type:complete len:157 (-) Transcript_83031:56-526(-)
MAAGMRRVDRVILGSPVVLRSISVVNVIGRPDNEMVQKWMKRFTPMLRYGNPNLVCEFRAIGAVQRLAAAEAGSDTATAAAEGAEEAASEAAPPDGADAAAGAGSSAAAVEEEKERIELEFTDGSSHLVNLSLYRWSHQVMQRILELDTEKGLSAV